MDEIVTVNHYEEDNSDLVPSQLPSMAAVKFCLFEELASRIKLLLFSSRKTSPICSVVLSFDSLHFDSLVVQGTRKEKREQEKFTKCYFGVRSQLVFQFIRNGTSQQ